MLGCTMPDDNVVIDLMCLGNSYYINYIKIGFTIDNKNYNISFRSDDHPHLINFWETINFILPQTQT